MRSLLSFISILTFLSASSQSRFPGDRPADRWRFTLGLSAGGMNCLTDLGTNNGRGRDLLKTLGNDDTRPCAGFLFSAERGRLLGLRCMISFGSLTASDSIRGPGDPASRAHFNRNLHFRSFITEALLMAEYYPLRLLFARWKNSRTLKPDLTVDDRIPFLLAPCIVAGFGWFHFSPRAIYNQNWVALRDLSTEGQGFKEYPLRKPYALTQINFPVGIGITAVFSSWMKLGMEIVYRILLTDYLDDVSKEYIPAAVFYRNFPADKAEAAASLSDRRRNATPSAARGDPANKDAYFSLNARMSIILR